MNFKKMVLSLFLKAVKHCVFVRDSGTGFKIVGPKTETDLFPKVSREKRGTVSREVLKRAQRPREIVWMQRVRNI